MTVPGGVLERGESRAPSAAPRGPRRTVRAALVVGLAVAMFALGGVGLWHGSDGGLGKRPQAPVRPSARGAGPAILTGTLSQQIASLQRRLRALPSDWSSWATLGLAYVQEARVTADPQSPPWAKYWS